MKRQVIPELLDTDSGSPDEIAASLADLRRINQWFGGVPTTASLVQEVAQQTGARAFSLLEVAAGSGDVPLAVAQQVRRHGIHLNVSLLDRASSHLKHRSNGTRAIAGDALALPFADSSFDLVSCCIFAHHLPAENVVRFANESLRVCRVAVLINDLVRHPLHLALVYAGFPLYRSSLTRHDAPASVRAAYTPDEMLALLNQTPATKVTISRHYLFRMGVTAWKRC